MTQQQLADAADISQQAIAGYELDVREPGRTAVQRLAAGLGVPYKAFATDVPVGPDDPRPPARAMGKRK
jgi:transcriptional regulator with XRE-family HTH domain